MIELYLMFVFTYTNTICINLDQMKISEGHKMIIFNVMYIYYGPVALSLNKYVVVVYTQKVPYKYILVSIQQVMLYHN